MSTSARLEELQKRFDENPRRFFAPLANEYRKGGDLDRAIEICQEHLADQPGNMNGHVVYGQALFEAGRYDEARDTFEVAVSLDPENLIALRHLGDIARSNADTAGARQWYTRVLDADPRNDEIIAFLAELDVQEVKTAAAAPPAAEESTTPTVVMTPPRSSTPVAPLSPTPVIPMEAIVAADQPPAAPDFGLMDLSMDFGTPEEVTFGVPGEDDAAPIITSAAELDELDLAGASLDTFAAAAAPLPVAEPEAPRTSFPSFADIGFGDEPEAPAALSAPDDFGNLAFTPPPLDEPAPVDDFQFGNVTPAFGTDAIVGRVPTFDPEASKVTETPAPFVTETMAELYLSQGFTDEALEVYKQLSAQNPDDENLKERVRSIASGGRSSLSLRTVSDDEPDTGARALASGGMIEPETIGLNMPAPVGPTARGFFAGLAARRPVSGEMAAVSSSPDEAPRSGPRLTVPAPVVQLATGGTLDTLFGNADPDAYDEHAATALSTFAEAVETSAPLIQGRPTQAAATELSLDSVFRDTPARMSAQVPRQSQKIRFDQFFSPAEDAPVEDSAPAAPPAGEPGSPAELEQFQDWLTQMKKP